MSRSGKRGIRVEESPQRKLWESLRREITDGQGPASRIVLAFHAKRRPRYGRTLQEISRTREHHACSGCTNATNSQLLPF
ncbi:UNVERIFIED_CONTAM: hypothetical protein Sradi_2071800 [Sesamum radiatum]|uniref:Uncharacterized protein n=1 Tax=Sesamum radiatum TaxID=300843 RepID=A0AAW2TIC8_SESRA